MPTYTPSFNFPITKSLTVTNSLIMGSNATGPNSIFSATDSFTAQTNTSYNWNVTSASQVVTLPLTPVNGAFVVINDNDWSWGNFSPSVEYNGATTKGAVANAADLSAQAGGEIKFIYNSSSNEWTSYLKPASTDDPFHGWWRNVKKGGMSLGISDDQAAGNAALDSGYYFPEADAGNCSYSYIDCISIYPQIKVTMYGGPYDEAWGAIIGESVYERLSDGVSIAVAGCVGTDSFSATNYRNLSNTFTANTLTLQSNGTQIFGATAKSTDPQYILNSAVVSEYDPSVCLLEKISSPPVIRPYNDNEVAFPDVQDPVFMFKYFAKIEEQKSRTTNNPATPESQAPVDDEWYPGYYAQQSILQSYLDGKTIVYPIHHVVKSTDFQYSPNTSNQGATSTGTTKIFLADNHLVTYGSTVTISGFSGEGWSSLNGEHENDVIFSYHYNTQSTGHFDCDTINKTGSFYNITNLFALRSDTYAYSGVQSGAYKGWAIYEGTPTISVTHHVTSDMPYHKWLAAMKAYRLEVYGTSDHADHHYLYDLNDGRIALDWDSSETNFGADSFTKVVARNGISFWYTSSTQPSYYNFIYGEHHNIAQVMVDALTGSVDSGFSIPALNYLDHNETYNLYYGFDGNFTTGTAGSVQEAQGELQQYYGEELGLMNVNVSGLTGGSILVATGAKYYGYTGAPGVDRTKWNIIGSNNAVNADEINYYNWFYYGLVDSNLTDNKTIGYFRAESLKPYDTNPSYIFGNNIWSDPNILQNNPNKNSYSNVVLAQYIPMMKYFKSKNVDGIIIDLRANFGGALNTIENLFGGNRLAVNTNSLLLNSTNQKGTLSLTSNYEYYEELNATGSTNYLVPDFIESAQGFGTGSVYHGSAETGGRIVLLESEGSQSAAIGFQWNMLGDELDGNIGNNTSTKVLGCTKGYLDDNPIASKPFYMTTPYITSSLRGTPIYYNGLVMPGPITQFKMSTGSSGAITYNHMNVIDNLTAVTAMTTSTGAYSGLLGNPFPCDMEHRVYPDFGFAVNDKPRLPGDSRSQQPDTTNSGTWRDGWLEAAIGEIVYGTW